MKFLYGYESLPGKEKRNTENATGFDQIQREKTGLKGFEPLTYGLRVRRSAELSYKPLI